MKVGLVLGAGGVAGGAWLTGALTAIATETGWDPGSADRIVGTSAGSVIGAFTAAGLPPWFMVAHSRGEIFEGLTGPDGRPASEADRSGGASFRLHRGLPPIGPGSLQLALSTLLHPMKHTPLELTVGWLPRGFVSTDALKDIVRRIVPTQWVDHPSFWAVACDYSSGKRTVFGRPGTPKAELADAVAASCAIPGFYRPVSVGGRRYVDGGVRSASNLDLLARRNLDLVICLNPTSTLEGGAPGANLLDRFLDLNRAASGRRLGSEAKRVRAGGTRVVLIQPTTRGSGRDRPQHDVRAAARRGHRDGHADRRGGGARAQRGGVAGRSAGGRAAQDRPPAGAAGRVAGDRARRAADERRLATAAWTARASRDRRTAFAVVADSFAGWRRDREERATRVARRATALPLTGHRPMAHRTVTSRPGASGWEMRRR